MSTVDNRFPTEGTQVDILAALLQIKSAIQGDVNWSQVLSSGTTIAIITIGENSYTVYAPTPPTKTSDITNDSGFITNTVNNLVNYYLKTDTYTKTEVNNLISAIDEIHIEVVATLPTTDISTNTIYFVPKSTAQTDNVYDEYINTDGTTAGWEKIGDTEIDLSNYYTKSEADTLLNGKVDKEVGKGLSTNDYTDTEKAKLAGIEANAEVNVQSDWSQADSSADDYIKNKPSNLVQDASYVHTDNNFTTSEKTKLSGIESGAEVNVQSDWNQTDNTADDYIKNKPSSEVKTATDTFTTVNGGLLEECNIELEPVQDLHGYDHPWVGGAGKNKLPLVLADIKSANTSGTWSDNVYTINGATFTVNTDDGENVTSIKANNTSNASGSFALSNYFTLASNSYNLSGCNNGSYSSYWINLYNNTTSSNIGDNLNGRNTLNINGGDSIRCRIMFASGCNFSNTEFYPMIALASETDFNFEPYTNECPISGHTEVDLQRDGKNLISGYTANRSVNGSGVITSDNSACITDKIYVNSLADYVLNSSKDATLIVGHCFNSSDSYLGYFTITNGVSFVPNQKKTGTTSIIFQWNKPNEGNILPTDGQLEKGNQATSYEPYLGHLYTVQIGSTVYGGSLDIVSGSGKDAYTNIASYSGETINEPWISSMDVYTEGGTPTTGAQVVYPKTTATAISTTPQQIEALPNQNNLSTPLDGQSIDSVKYREVFAFDDVEKVVSLRVPISMLGTDESGRTTASQAYASGDYFYKDGYMCKALTSISAGATLTLNTNYSQGTLADILKAIENA